MSWSDSFLVKSTTSPLWELFKLKISSRCFVSVSPRSFLYFSSRSFSSHYICSLLCFIKVLDCHRSSSSTSFYFKVSNLPITSFAIGVYRSTELYSTPGAINFYITLRSLMQQSKSFCKPYFSALRLLPCYLSASKDSDASSIIFRSISISVFNALSFSWEVLNDCERTY